MASSFHMYGIENKIYKTKHKQQYTKFYENLNGNQIVRKQIIIKELAP